MEKQVKVKVSWNEKGVQLSTDRKMNYYFGSENKISFRGTCRTIVSGLVSSLIIPTVVSAFDASDSNEFSFEFKVMDKKKS